MASPGRFTPQCYLVTSLCGLPAALRQWDLPPANGSPINSSIVSLTPTLLISGPVEACLACAASRVWTSLTLNGDARGRRGTRKACLYGLLNCTCQTCPFQLYYISAEQECNLPV